jgi:hypothetical protein
MVWYSPPKPFDKDSRLLREEADANPAGMDSRRVSTG